MVKIYIWNATINDLNKFLYVDAFAFAVGESFYSHSLTSLIKFKKKLFFVPVIVIVANKIICCNFSINKICN